MAEALSWACALATIFLVARQSTWAWAMVRLWQKCGLGPVRAHLLEEVTFTRGVLRAGTFTVSIIPAAALIGWESLAWGALYVLIGWRIVHYAADRRFAVVSLAGLLACGVTISVTGGQL